MTKCSKQEMATTRGLLKCLSGHEDPMAIERVLRKALEGTDLSVPVFRRRIEDAIAESPDWG